MSSSGEMKISLKLMICQRGSATRSGVGGGRGVGVRARYARAFHHTFSWRRCFNSFNSRYVRFERTGVLNGFMIFLTATAWPVSWSLAELNLQSARDGAAVGGQRRVAHTKQGRRRPCRRAGDRCICGATVSMVGGGASGGVPSYRLVISKVVPKIWARTNSAIAITGGGGC